MSMIETSEPIRFLGIPAESAELSKARFVVLPVPYEFTTSYKRGTRFGPQAMLNASYQVEFFDEELGKETWTEGIHTLPPFPCSEPPEKFLQHLADYIRPFISQKKQVFIVGGEHTISAGPIRAYASAYPKLSLFHIDAHPDLRDEYEGSKYNHACALRRAVDYAPVVQVGIRSVYEGEYPLLNTARVKTFMAHEHREVERLIPKVLEALSDDVYITIDLDGFDPSVIPGVGTPVPGGLSWYEGLALLRAVITHKNVVAVDVMELCPLQDTVISEFTTAKLIYRLMGYLTLPKRRAGVQRDSSAIADARPRRKAKLKAPAK